MKLQHSCFSLPGAIWKAFNSMPGSQHLLGQPSARIVRKVQRDRLKRGGDRAANSALHIIVICGLRLDEVPQA